MDHLSFVTLLVIAGALLFRLAENVSALVVHERVKRRLEAQNLGLTFDPPEEWFG